MMKGIKQIGALLAFLAISGPLVAAPKIMVITADPGSPPEQNDISTYCSLKCAMRWQTKTSSHLKPQGQNRYDVGMLGDGLVNTAWIEGIKGYGIGETITFTFTPQNFKEANLEKVNLEGFFVINGYCKNKTTWKENSRVKRIQMENNGQPRCEAILHDSMNVQQISFPETVWLHPGDTIKVTILDVYPGDKYQDTGISELIPLGAH